MLKPSVRLPSAHLFTNNFPSAACAIVFYSSVIISVANMHQTHTLYKTKTETVQMFGDQ